MNEGDDVHRSLERLVALGQTPEVNIRPVLLRVLVDLFVRKTCHSLSETSQFEEIVQKLLEAADEDTRLIVAEKLSHHRATPRALLDRFLAERGPAAALVLAHAPVDRDALLAAASWGTPDMAAAVARRSGLDLALCRSLSERPEREVLLALIRNPTAPLDRPLFQYMVRRARGDDELSRLLLERPCEAADLAPFFLLATGEQRAAILLSMRRDDFGPESRRPRLNEEEAAALTRVERSLLSSDQDSFDAALAAALNLSLAETWRIIDDRRGEPLAVALTAIGASPEFAARVFILSGPSIGHSVMAVRSLVAIVDSLPMRTASRLLAAMTGTSAKASRSRTQPEVEAGGRRRSVADSRPVQPALAALQRRTSGARSPR